MCTNGRSSRTIKTPSSTFIVLSGSCSMQNICYSHSSRACPSLRGSPGQVVCVRARVSALTNDQVKKTRHFRTDSRYGLAHIYRSFCAHSLLIPVPFTQHICKLVFRGWPALNSYSWLTSKKPAACNTHLMESSAGVKELPVVQHACVEILGRDTFFVWWP